MDSYAIGGRKRAPSNHTIEDQALDQIAKQVEYSIKCIIHEFIWKLTARFVIKCSIEFIALYLKFFSIVKHRQTRALKALCYRFVIVEMTSSIIFEWRKGLSGFRRS